MSGTCATSRSTGVFSNASSFSEDAGTHRSPLLRTKLCRRASRRHKSGGIGGDEKEGVGYGKVFILPEDIK